MNAPSCCRLCHAAALMQSPQAQLEDAEEHAGQASRNLDELDASSALLCEICFDVTLSAWPPRQPFCRIHTRIRCSKPTCWKRWRMSSQTTCCCASPPHSRHHPPSRRSGSPLPLASRTKTSAAQTMKSRNRCHKAPPQIPQAARAVGFLRGARMPLQTSVTACGQAAAQKAKALQHLP